MTRRRRRRFIIIKVCRALSSHNGGRVRARRDPSTEEGRGFDNGHIKAALLPEKGDDEPGLKLKKFPRYGVAE